MNALAWLSTIPMAAAFVATTSVSAAALFVAVLLTPLAATRADEKLTPAEAKEIAKEAFLWGMH
ncbi:MAG: hypothetical protein ACK2UO_21320, partial [Caldilineaceae bacterium]